MNLYSRIFGVSEGKAKVPFGSVMPQIDLETRLAQLHKKLNEIRGMQELQRSEAWLGMRQLLLSEVSGWEQIIFSLCGDPVKNQASLIRAMAARETLAAIVLMQDKLPVEAEKLQAAITEKLELLKQVRDLPRPSADAPGEDEAHF
ncbi:MAG: hypothetical protein ABIH23_14505 [bacterium]